MKIVLLIFIILIIILIVLFFQYKPIETFENNNCLLTNEQNQNIFIMKNNIQLISDIVNSLYDIANRLNNVSIEKKILDQTSPTNADLYNQALSHYNTSYIKKKIYLILDDKNIINNYYNNRLEYYNKQTLNCS
jgi:hypothetical protein